MSFSISQALNSKFFKKKSTIKFDDNYTNWNQGILWSWSLKPKNQNLLGPNQAAMPIA